MTASQIADPVQALAFMFAGNARVTLVSGRTGKRFTYRIRVCADKPTVWFAGLLVGSDNESSYEHIAHCHGTGPFVPSRGKPISTPLTALRWAVGNMRRGVMPDDLEVWHEGRCGKCARPLTVPESIASGFGPECMKQRKAA